MAGSESRLWFTKHTRMSLLVAGFIVIGLGYYTRRQQKQRQALPKDCPGVGGPEAGRAAACDGCPNRKICASNQEIGTGIAEVQEQITRQLRDVRNIIVVLSGKGGVGKSTVAAQLAWELESQGHSVGIMDIDICGPSIPRMTSTRGESVRAFSDGWCPVARTPNLQVMSVGFLTPNEEDAVIWRGPKKNGLIRQFLTDVRWGELDYLIIDTPPGTSDEHLTIISYLEKAGISGAIVVTTPQQVSLQDVRKELRFCEQANVRVLGVVENMTKSLFVLRMEDGAREMCKTMNVPYAGQLDLSEDLFNACEDGRKVGAGTTASAQVQHILRFCQEQIRSV